MTFSDLFAASQAGAAKIYHAVVATGVAVTEWENSPATAPLVDLGVTEANGLLNRCGLQGAVITGDITTALKLIAATDPTVPSTGPIGGFTQLAGLAETAIAVAVPPAIPVMAAAETVAVTAENLACAI
jgi:hypothetical protein